MNRIYQGRVSKIQIPNTEGFLKNAPHGNSETCVLWQHHCIFQDAVNYYLAALGSLADSDSDNRVIGDLRARFLESWERFPRDIHGASSLRDSLRRSLPGLKQSATLQEGFDLILAGNEASPRAKVLSLLSLLHDLGGDIQKGSKRFFPFFCESGTKATFPRARVGLLKAEGKDLVPDLLWNLVPVSDPEQLVSRLKFEYFANPNESVPAMKGDEAKSRLIEALGNPQLTAAISELVCSELRDAIDCKELDYEIPRYFFGGAGAELRQLRLDVFLLAKHALPHPELISVLRNSYKAPPVAKKSKDGDETEAILRSLDNDPLIIARGPRGYIFPSFTSLPLWFGVSNHEPVWREFDIAAFAEALKSLNQFKQKTDERDVKLKTAKQTLDYMLGKSDTLPKSSDGEGETKAPSRPGKDARWPKVAELERELGENLNEGAWQLSRASLRGLRDIVELWQKKPNASPAELQGEIKRYQADDKHKREIGSVQLFLMLCEERYQDLWRSDSQHHDDDEADHAVGILSDAIQVHQLEREVARFGDPIRLTPAEPAFSRRLFMFSDLTDKLAKVKFGESDGNDADGNVHFVETAIALADGTGLRETRVRINFTAPRLSRDELLGGAESRWLQPMTAALFESIKDFNPCSVKKGVALMPSLQGDREIRHLLNFPYTLNPQSIIEAVYHSRGQKAKVSWISGKGIVNQSFWQTQFHENWEGKSLKSRDFLMWPGTKPSKTKPVLAPLDKEGWWNHPALIAKGFTVLSTDLGQRSAGGWALLKVTCSKPETKRPVRSIGHDGKREWYAEVLKSGMYRLPGEDQQVQKNGEWVPEKSGKTGRMAEDDEYTAAFSLAKKLLGAETDEAVGRWLGPRGERSFPELNDQLIKIANRRLTRLGTYHRWSCFRPENLDDPKRKANVIEGQIVELEAYQDKEVLAWRELLKAGDIAGFRDQAGRAFETLRCDLEDHLTNLANLTAPLRQKLWTWQPRPGDSKYGDLLMVDFEDSHPKVRGQRGLSMPRLEQLDGLRRLFLRYNRSLDREKYTPVKFGRADEGRTSGEPCQALLDKIDRMKEQRVNQTAHLILAQALGVRLRPHQVSDDERRNRDIHGEYEKIEGREPVDFIVIEDLSRYLSSQGRSPSENSRLMKWAHRAVRDKLKMLAEEPFGIPVVETVPAYSSRFHAHPENGQPGSRLHELHELATYQIQSLENLAAKTEPKERHRAKSAADLLEQFKAIHPENERRKAINRNRAKGIPALPLLTLYFPKAGGPLFLAVRDGNPVQADLNAAINLGYRAIAAPNCIEVHRRVRATKEKDVYRPKLGNAREKAAFSKDDSISVDGALSKKFGASSSPNFFFEPDGLVQVEGDALFDRATLNGHALVSGLALWSTVNNAIYPRCAELNRQRIKRWKLEDDIPM